MPKVVNPLDNMTWKERFEYVFHEFCKLQCKPRQSRPAVSFHTEAEMIQAGMRCQRILEKTLAEYKQETQLAARRKNIRCAQALRRKNVTGAEIAIALEISESTVWDYLTNRRGTATNSGLSPRI